MIIIFSQQNILLTLPTYISATRGLMYVGWLLVIILAVAGDELVCRRERWNYHDIYAVSVMKSMMKDSVVAGHLPRKISPVASLFLMKGGTILCRAASAYNSGHARVSKRFQFFSGY